METRRQSFQCPIFGSVQNIKGQCIAYLRRCHEILRMEKIQIKVSRNTINEHHF